MEVCDNDKSLQDIEPEKKENVDIQGNDRIEGNDVSSLTEKIEVKGEENEEIEEKKEENIKEDIKLESLEPKETKKEKIDEDRMSSNKNSTIGGILSNIKNRRRSQGNTPSSPMDRKAASENIISSTERPDGIQNYLSTNPRKFMDMIDEETKRNSVMLAKEINEVIGTRKSKDGGPFPKALSLIDRVNLFKKRYTIIEQKESDWKPIQEIENKKKLNVFDELLQTERVYVNNLKMIHRLFLQPIRDKKILNTFETVTLFSNLEIIIEKNCALLDDLETIPDMIHLDHEILPTYSRWIGEIFEFHSPLFQSTYATYCTNQPTIDSSLRQYKSNASFGSFIRSVHRNPECKKQTLNSYLIQPLQRLCKYPLLLKEIINHTKKDSLEMEELEKGFKCILSCVDEVNKKVKQVENLTKLTEVNLALTNGLQYRDLMINPDREFVLNEYMLVNDNIRNVYLFNHFILVCKQTPPELKLNQNNDIEHTIVDILLMNMLLIRNVDSDEAHLFEIVHSNTPFKIQCKDYPQKKRWMRHIQKLRLTAPSDLTLDDNEPKLRSKTILLGNTSKTKYKRFSFGKMRKTDSGKPIINIDKMQTDLRNEQLRRRIEEDNTKTYKIMYDELEAKYNIDTENYKEQISELETMIEALEAKLIDLELSQEKTS